MPCKGGRQSSSRRELVGRNRFYGGSRRARQEGVGRLLVPDVGEPNGSGEECVPRRSRAGVGATCEYLSTVTPTPAQDLRGTHSSPLPLGSPTSGTSSQATPSCLARLEPPIKSVSPDQFTTAATLNLAPLQGTYFPSGVGRRHCRRKIFFFFWSFVTCKCEPRRCYISLHSQRPNERRRRPFCTAMGASVNPRRSVFDVYDVPPPLEVWRRVKRVCSFRVISRWRRHMDWRVALGVSGTSNTRPL